MSDAFTAAAQEYREERQRVERLSAHRPETPKPSITNDEAGRPAFFSGASLAGRDVPERRWIIPDLVPDRTVTLLGGDGGTGKSLIALQLAFAVATGTPWLGQQTENGRVIYISAEDDAEELHRRLAAIASSNNTDLAELEALSLRSLAGCDALMATEHQGALIPAPTLVELREKVLAESPSLVVLDTLADFYPSNENDRAKVRQFIAMLRAVALDFNCAVLLLAHPSLSGLSSGSGLSGSTAWNNSVRSRLYLERVIEDGHEPDPDVRRLSNKKSNYGRTGIEIALRYLDGTFMAESGATGLDRLAASAKAERVFLKLLADCNATGRNVNHAGGQTYAPNVFAGHPNAEGVTKRAFRAAMDSLLHKGQIAIAETGPPSKRRQHLEVKQ